MFKEYMIVILLHLLLIEKAKAKEEALEISKSLSGSTPFDDAIGMCIDRPGRNFDTYLFNPPVSSQ
jgi:hypothetical protein